MECCTYLHGGGTRLAAHLGALQALQERNGKTVAWAGASAGSLVAAVMAAGFSHRQACELMLDTDYRMFLDRSAFRMLRDYGLCSGKRFEKWLDGVLGGARFDSLDVPLSVVATNVATGDAHVFSQRQTPELKVATAVRCSIGIPGVFGVRRVGTDMFVDGALTVIDPARLFPFPADASVVVRLRAHALPMARRRSFGPAAYVRRIMEIMLRCADDLCSPEWFTHDIQLHLAPDSPVAFGMTPAEKRELYELGREQCAAVFADRCPQAGTQRPDAIGGVSVGERARNAALSTGCPDSGAESAPSFNPQLSSLMPLRP